MSACREIAVSIGNNEKSLLLNNYIVSGINVTTIINLHRFVIQLI